MMAKLLIILMLVCLSGRVQASTLFEDLGGRPKITIFTDDMVERVIHDDRIKQFFKETDIPRLKSRITDQICHLSGEKKSYRGANMKNAHSDFPIHVADFNALVEDLQFAMDDSEIPFTTQNRLLALLAPMERDIVNK